MLAQRDTLRDARCVKTDRDMSISAIISDPAIGMTVASRHEAEKLRSPAFFVVTCANYRKYPRGNLVGAGRKGSNV